ncbi:MAG: NlpC/P60 family protein [Pseudomonadota bacterium]
MKKPVMTARLSYPDRATLSASWAEAARQWINTPYRHQACRRGVGVDCVGLVAGVWADVYGSKPDYRRDYTKDWAEVGSFDLLLDACRARCKELESLEEALPGDILLFRIRPEAMAKHVGIYSGANRMIHAAERHCVGEVNLHAWWHRRLVGVFAPPLQTKS